MTQVLPPVVLQINSMTKQMIQVKITVAFQMVFPKMKMVMMSPTTTTMMMTTICRTTLLATGYPDQLPLQEMFHQWQLMFSHNLMLRMELTLTLFGYEHFKKGKSM